MSFSRIFNLFCVFFPLKCCDFSGERERIMRPWSTFAKMVNTKLGENEKFKNASYYQNKGLPNCFQKHKSEQPAVYTCFASTTMSTLFPHQINWLKQQIPRLEFNKLCFLTWLKLKRSEPEWPGRIAIC